MNEVTSFIINQDHNYAMTPVLEQTKCSYKLIIFYKYFKTYLLTQVLVISVAALVLKLSCQCACRFTTLANIKPQTKDSAQPKYLNTIFVIFVVVVETAV